MDKDNYITRVLKDHQLDETTYQLLPPGAIEEREKKIREKLSEIVEQKKKDKSLQKSKMYTWKEPLLNIHVSHSSTQQ